MSSTEKFEDKIFQAIVDQFFAPRPAGVDANGSAIWQESHVAGVARQFMSGNRDKLYEAILERITVEQVAEKAAELVLAELEKKQDTYWSIDPNRDVKANLTKAVRQRVADELAKRQLAALDENDKQGERGV